MLMTGLASRYAHQLIQAREKGEMLPSLSSRYPLTVEDAYEIAEKISEIRIAEGENVIGWKFDYFTDTSSENREKVRFPFWSRLYDTTVHFMENSEGRFSLKNLSAPAMEAEVIFRLGKLPPENADVQQLADCIEWMAHGIEITNYPFQTGTKSLVDAIIAFGMHGALLVGEPKIVSEGSRKSLYAVSKCASLSVACNDVIRTAGFGSEATSNPLQGLLTLYQLLNAMPGTPSLHIGDIVATGSWTKPLAVHPGEVWQTAVSGLLLPGLTVELTS